MHDNLVRMSPRDSLYHKVPGSPERAGVGTRFAATTAYRKPSAAESASAKGTDKGLGTAQVAASVFIRYAYCIRYVIKAARQHGKVKPQGNQNGAKNTVSSGGQQPEKKQQRNLDCFACGKPGGLARDCPIKQT